MKICTKCNIEKELCEFVFRIDVNRYESRCLECTKQYQKEYYNKNKTKLIKKSNSYYSENREKVLKRLKKYVNENKEIIKKRKKEDYIKHSEKIKLRVTEWRKNNKDRKNKLEKEKRNNDPIYKLIHYLRCRVNQYIKKKNYEKNKKSMEIVGLSPCELKEHIEKQFKDGMSWFNYGEWHIDHIIPLSSANTEEELYSLCFYTNLQPLWAVDNLSKGNKILK